MKKILLFSWLLTGLLSARSQELNIIPKPASVILKEGAATLGARSRIVIPAGSSRVNVNYLNEYLSSRFGYTLPVVNKASASSIAQVQFLPAAKGASPESYSLSITPALIRIQGDERGQFYGIQTLLQLIEQGVPENGKESKLPALLIEDKPRFSYRGLMLDVGRHMYPVSFIRKFIDLMAYYKFNTFHWHLTEDQGWRIEIKKYPRLTQVGSERKETIRDKNFDPYIGDGQAYGGYYSQQEIREVVKYAASRHITVIPEIEMPGHALAALASYPHLGCNKGPYEVGTRWGVYDDVYCGGNDSTYAFLQDVLTEVISLFPSRYIHIGGDESPKAKWKTCPVCQDRIRKEGLKDEHELQSYFIQRIEKFLNQKGRQIIGWDEILEGGLAPNATVMSWRGESGGIEAARQKHDVIMTPTTYVYFDYYQAKSPDEPLAIGGFLPIEKVYHYDPTPKELDTAYYKYIKGAQANLWTEYLRTSSKAEYMLFPRVLALAEVVWTPRELKNYDDFMKRVSHEFNRLDRHKVNYAKHVLGLEGKVIGEAGKPTQVILSTRNSLGVIRYTLDGSEPTASSPNYTAPVEFNKTGTLRANLFVNNEKYGSEFRQAYLSHRAVGKEVSMNTPPSVRYNPGSPYFLVNGIEGDPARNDNQWFGFEGTHMEAVIDMGEVTQLNRVGLNFLQFPAAWIYHPSFIRFSVSEDGVNFREVASADAFGPQPVEKVRFPLSGIRGRYIKVEARNLGIIPDGQSGAGHGAWMFIDEVIIE